nr:hypothetical protein [Candidatus Sigynarchaeota archaeon]
MNIIVYNAVTDETLTGTYTVYLENIGLGGSNIWDLTCNAKELEGMATQIKENYSPCRGVNKNSPMLPSSLSKYASTTCLRHKSKTHKTHNIHTTRISYYKTLVELVTIRHFLEFYSIQA